MTLRFDAHSDLLFNVIRERELGRERVIQEEFLPGMEAGGIDARVAAIYVDEGYLPEMALRRGLDIAEALSKEVEATDELRLATTVGEIRDAAVAGEYALVLGMEGAEPLKGDLEMLDVFYRLGLRVFTLTHSRRNAAGDGSFFTPTRAGEAGGLSPFGVDAVERANELGVAVDVSHLNEPGFWDAVEFSTEPVIASHSCCRALRDHPRNLRDDQIEAVADSGGIVGITAVGRFLAEEGEGPSIETFVDHVEHAVDLVGAEHVGVGFDFVEYLRQYLSDAERERLPDPMPVEGLQHDGDVADLEPALADRFDGDDVEGILGGNFLRVLEEILGG